ncbi:MAG: class I SAM-dependent methyltransferase [Xanthobacteraceae bacterium]
MKTLDRQAHWEAVYAAKCENEVSWFEQSPSISLGLIAASDAKPGTSIIDIGGGASRLVDALVEGDFEVTVLDVSEKALAAAKARLGSRASRVKWLVADVTTWNPSRTYDVWHDRAALHFLTDPKDREAYIDRIFRAVRPGGHVIIGTFALDGPERCSGLPVLRYDAASLARLLGGSFELVETRAHNHQTPSGSVQQFQFSRFRRLK